MRVAPRFRALLASFDLAEFEREASTIYGLWPDTRIAYFNVAYLRFAEEGGAPGLLARFGLGARVADTVPPLLAPSFGRLIARARAADEPVTHEYECHSPALHRRYQQRLLPLGRGAGLLCVHSLIVARPHDDPRPADEAPYRGAHDIIVQCAHCRRVRRVGEPRQWDLVPDFVANVPERTSHGLCEACLGYYFPVDSPTG